MDTMIRAVHKPRSPGVQVDRLEDPETWAERQYVAQSFRECQARSVS